MSISFIVGTERFLLTPEEYSKSALLKELVDLDPTAREVEVQCTCEEFTIVYNFLKFEKIPSMTEFSLIEYFGLSFRDSYGLSCLLEDDMRENMYSGVDTGRDYFDPYYGLYLIDEYFWTELQCKRTYTPDLLFADAPPPVKASWREIQERLETLRPFLLPGVVIAGGAIFSILFGQKIHDIDLFLYDTTEEEALVLLHQIGEVARSKAVPPEERRKRKLYHEKVSRSKNAVTFYVTGQPDVQVILRLYPTPSSICSAFDICSCCLGWDGENLFGTYRGIYSLQNLTNMVNFGRLSPSYERRLVKYASRGIAVRVPDFDRSLVNEEMLDADLFSVYPVHVTKSNIYSNMSKLRELQGLSILLLLERFAQKIDYRERLQRLASRLSSEVSDYSFTSLNTHEGSTLREILLYLERSKMDPSYFESSDRYVPLLRELHKQGLFVHCNDDGDRDVYVEKVLGDGSRLYPSPKRKQLKKCLDLRVANPCRSKTCYFVRAPIEQLDLILDFPQIYHDILATVKPVEFPPKIEWKVTQPGEQMTNTLHRIVLKDNREWYRGPYYANGVIPPAPAIPCFVLPWYKDPEEFLFTDRCILKHRAQLYFGAEGCLFRFRRKFNEVELYEYFTPEEIKSVVPTYDLILKPGQYRMKKSTVYFGNQRFNAPKDYAFGTDFPDGTLILSIC